MKLSSIVDLILKSSKPKLVSQKIVAIDGCGGAGKSTLASMMAQSLNCDVIHTDDFASWDNQFDWHPRMITQVLEPLSKGQSAVFQRYDWNKKQLSDWITIKPQEFIILEGVSSSRREFRPYLSFGIFVKTDSNLRLSRGLARDGIQAKDQWLKWMHEEDLYISRDNPEEYAQIVIDGSTPLEG